MVLAGSWNTPFAFASEVEKVARSTIQPTSFCKNLLRADSYRLTTIFAEDEPTQTLIAERGSIEDASPGIIGELVRLRIEFLEIKKLVTNQNSSAMTLSGHLAETAISRLNGLSRAHPDPRLQLLIATLVPKILRKEARLKRLGADRDLPKFLRFVDQLTANLWELIVACLFDGSRIYLNQNTASLYPRAIARLNNYRVRPTNGLDREIDVAVKNHDGSWRWIEVKDWSTRTALDSDSQLRLGAQFLGQEQLRMKLDLNIKLILVMKYGLAPLDSRHYHNSFGYDQILFVFPTVWDQTAATTQR